MINKVQVMNNNLENQIIEIFRIVIIFGVGVKCLIEVYLGWLGVKIELLYFCWDFVYSLKFINYIE